MYWDLCDEKEIRLGLKDSIRSVWYLRGWVIRRRGGSIRDLGRSFVVVRD